MDFLNGCRQNRAGESLIGAGQGGEKDYLFSIGRMWPRIDTCEKHELIRQDILRNCREAVFCTNFRLPRQTGSWADPNFFDCPDPEKRYRINILSSPSVRDALKERALVSPFRKRLVTRLHATGSNGMFENTFDGIGTISPAIGMSIWSLKKQQQDFVPKRVLYT